MINADQDTLKTIATLRNEIEAQELVNILNEHGIEARAVGGFTANFQAGGPGGVKVLVHENAFDEARELLSEITASNVDDEALVEDSTLRSSDSFSEVMNKPWSLLMAAEAGIMGMLLYWVGGGRAGLGFVAAFLTFSSLLFVILWVGNRNREDSTL